jgi:hypothetical protein
MALASQGQGAAGPARGADVALAWLQRLPPAAPAQRRDLRSDSREGRGGGSSGGGRL